MTRQIMIAALMIASLPAMAAEFAINGTVLEKGTRTPLQGVVVTVKEQAVAAAVSDAKGNFRITLPAEGSYSLIATNSGISATLDVRVAEGGPLPAPVFYLRVPESLGEMVVTAERSPDQVSKNAISGKALRRIAGSSGDPLRALQTLPGVATVNGSSAPAVRGSGPGDNAYYVDGLPIPKLFHYGSISVFNADLIEDFNLYSAAFGPHYGEVTGAVIDVALREPRKDRLGGKVDVNVMGANFLVEGPRSDDQSFYFAARRSYIDLLVKQVEQKGMTMQIPNYWDYQGKYLWKLNDANRLTFHVQGASDVLRLKVDAAAEAAQKQPVLAGDSAFSSVSSMQAAVADTLLSGGSYNTLSFEHTGNRSSSMLGTAGTLNLAQDNYLLRERVHFELGAGHELSLGSELAHAAVRIDADFINVNCTQFDPGCDLSSAPREQLSETIATNAWSVSVQDRKRVLAQVTLIGGIRHSREYYAHKSYTEPRVGAEWEWSEQTLFTAGWGRHNQYPSGGQWVRVFGNPKLDHIRAEHSVLGVKHKVSADWNWKAETYYKKLGNLVVSDPALNYINAASGKAYGLELLIKKEETDRLSGWFVLNLAKSQRRNDVTGESFRFEYDQPVNATLVGTYKLTEAWSVGAKWNYHSGTPFTPVIGTSGTYADGRPIPVYAGVNSETLPVYHRLDLRLDRNYVFNKWKFNTYFELNNVYQRKDIVGYSYNASYTSREPVAAFVLPFSFGVQAEF
ncbi:MAG: carboxypeptidase regulatory-like domain-containing protein [Nitrosomonadales bacterium]|nr:carboxypeptidase regulatory-like domain-containing protein [Nitrosomonadales bacterium]